MKVENILCCDWGTSSFRLRLLNLKGEVVAETKSDQGVLATHVLWEKLKEVNAIKKFEFYLAYIRNRMASLQCNDAIDVLSLPIVISGMASSSIGMKNLPYTQLPFNLNGSVGYEVIEDENKIPILLVTGVASDEDIMRGEETQIMGLFHLPTIQAILPSKGLYILPGTHSKHIEIENGLMVNFKTFITGELFQLLQAEGTISKSIIASKDDTINDLKYAMACDKGVMQSKTGLLQNELFKIRANDILNNLTKEENYYYLSGLLIGNELAYLATGEKLKNKIVIGASEQLASYYKQALITLGLEADSIIIESAQFEKATAMGQLAVYKHYAQIK
jgi:2-dehydro-3-deoxygalactonokinase